MAGLGNQHATPDAFHKPLILCNPHAISLFMYQMPMMQTNAFRADFSGVMGTTWHRKCRYNADVAEDVKPCCIIVINTLSAASISRIGTTIQLSDTGIRPGSGLDF